MELVRRKNWWVVPLLILVAVVLLPENGAYASVRAEAGEKEYKEYVSAVGDPGMKRDGLRVAIEAWNQCNEVGEEVPLMGSPRHADCFDLSFFRSLGNYFDQFT